MNHLHLLVVRPIDENWRHAGRQRGFDVPAGVADEVRSRKVDPQLFSRRQQHPRLRFAASAIVSVHVRADFDIVQRDRGLEQAMQIQLMGELGLKYAGMEDAGETK